MAIQILTLYNTFFDNNDNYDNYKHILIIHSIYIIHIGTYLLNLN